MPVNNNDYQPQVNSDQNLVDAKISIGGFQFSDMTVKEINMGESLLTPGLQTSVTIQSFIYSDITKNFDQFKNAILGINMSTKAGETATIGQTIYRMDNREFMPVNVGQTEEFTIHACDQTLLNDAENLVSRLWKCTSPRTIVNDVLSGCAGAKFIDIQKVSGPSKDYKAERIHPFQVVAQQANVALNGDNPDFVHYMTYDIAGGPGRHNFRSLSDLCSKSSVRTYTHYETGVLSGTAYNQHKDAAIAFSFPCDFDYLSDLLNGAGSGGSNLNTGGFFNSVSGAVDTQFQGGCGPGYNFKASITNKGSSDQYGCEMEVEQYLLKRQARMALLEKDKVALRLISPWAPNLHAGDIITLNWTNKKTGAPVYGSGDYLISSLKHNIQLGGYATTTLDCVSRTIGGGIV